MNFKYQKGFTLIEQVIVLAIISILVAIVTINTSGIVGKYKTSRIQADLVLLETTANQYYYGKQSTDIYGAIDQQLLVDEGYLIDTIASPVEAYDYHIQVNQTSPHIIVRLIDDNSNTYTQGDYIAQWPE